MGLGFRVYNDYDYESAVQNPQAEPATQTFGMFS